MSSCQCFSDMVIPTCSLGSSLGETCRHLRGVRNRQKPTPHIIYCSRMDLLCLFSQQAGKAFGDYISPRSGTAIGQGKAEGVNTDSSAIG